LYSVRLLSGALLISASQTSRVDQLVVHAHAKTQRRGLRHQRRIGKNLVDIIENERGFDDRHTVVDEGGHDSARIELEISRLVLIAAQREHVLLRVAALLLQRDAHLLRTDRVDVVVELQHIVLLPLPVRSFDIG